MMKIGCRLHLITMNIREAYENEFDQIRPILHEPVSADEIYAYDRDITKCKQ